jgi:succinate dehydrogenase / fumarate reductase iron-sulfur subunit
MNTTSARRRLTLRIWRQTGPETPGRFEQHEVTDLHPDLSLLEVLDALNERLVRAGQRPIAFESDCREGICGACGLVVDGRPHGPLPRTTTCQVFVRTFADGATVTLAPFATGTFPVMRDLMVDRGALDRIVAAGGYVSVRAGSAPEANTLPVSKPVAEAALDAAACIGCGACVAACPNGSASLFVGAKLRHLSLLPQGQPERHRRAQAMIAAADAEGFGGCSGHGACQDACPQGIDLRSIVRLHREVLGATLAGAQHPRR